MPNITNVQRAFNQISDKSLEHEGELDIDTFMGFFNQAVKEFNLNVEKVAELKAMKYPIEVNVTSLAGITSNDVNWSFSENDTSEPTPIELTENDVKLLLEKLQSLEGQVINLTNALAKIATYSGHGNHLREFNIDKWEPTKQDMCKYS